MGVVVAKRVVLTRLIRTLGSLLAPTTDNGELYNLPLFTASGLNTSEVLLLFLLIRLAAIAWLSEPLLPGISML